MKILFLIGSPPNTAVSSWKEIQQHQKYGFIPTREVYDLIKALEKNAEFEKTIISARKKAGLPEKGISWQKYTSTFFSYKVHKLPGNKRKKAIDLMSRAMREVFFLRGKDFNYHISKQLHHLIYGNFVHFEFPPIFWYYHRDHNDDGGEYYYYLSIRVHNKIAKNELINYIENNWKDISRSMHLPPKNKFFISPRDNRIIELRDKKKLTFNQIADQIISDQNLTNSDGKINQDSVKTAYSRAKKKILSLTKESNI